MKVFILMKSSLLRQKYAVVLIKGVLFEWNSAEYRWKTKQITGTPYSQRLTESLACIIITAF